MPIPTPASGAKLVYRNGSWETVELAGEDVRPLVHTILLEATPDNGVHPLVHIVLEPSSLELDVEVDQATTEDETNAYGRAGVGLEEMDVARFASEIGVHPDAATEVLAGLVVMIHEGRL